MPNTEQLSLSEIMRRLRQVEDARRTLLSTGESMSRGEIPVTKETLKLYERQLSSLDKERSDLLRIAATLTRVEQSNLRQQQKPVIQKPDTKLIELTQKQNRETFRNLFRYHAGLGEEEPLPPVAQRYYGESLVDPQRAALSAARDYALAKMMEEWPAVLPKVRQTLEAHLGRKLVPGEIEKLQAGDLRTIVEANELLKTDRYRKLLEIDPRETTNLSPAHMFVHGYRPMTDASGLPFWGKFEKTPDDRVNLIKLSQTPEGVKEEKVLFGRYIYGSKVPEEILTGRDLGATPVPGGPPGLFQLPDKTYIYRTYQGFGQGQGIIHQDVPIRQVQTVTIDELLKPENVAKAGYTFRGGAMEPSQEAKAYMVLDALNKQNLAAGKGVVYVLSPEEMARAKAGVDEYSRKLVDITRGLAAEAAKPKPAPAPAPAPAAAAIPPAVAESKEKYAEYEKELAEKVQRGELSPGSAFWMRQPGIRALFTDHAPERVIVREELKRIGGDIVGLEQAGRTATLQALREYVPGASRIIGPAGEYTGPSTLREIRELLDKPLEYLAPRRPATQPTEKPVSTDITLPTFRAVPVSTEETLRKLLEENKKVVYPTSPFDEIALGGKG